MSSIFTRIIQGEIPCYKVAETDEFFAFLDINPLAKGHTLVIPKAEVDYIFDLESDVYLRLFAFAQKIAKAIDMVVPSEKIGIAVIGLEVRHAHIHLVPQQHMGTLNFTNPKLKLPAEEMAEIAHKIGKKYQSL